MPLETKGTIKFDPDVKAGDAEYIVECKPLGICAGGSGDLEGMISDLTEQVRVAISEEFHIPRCDVQMTRYAMTCTFDVSAPVHRTLDQFGILKETAGIVNAGILNDSKYTVTASVINPISGNLPKKKKGTKEKGATD